MIPKNLDKLIPSPVDYRDIPMVAVVDLQAPIPAEFELGFELTQKDQDGLPQCAGYTGTTIKEEKEHEEGNIIIFDPDWLYRECKKIDELPWDAGTYFRCVLSVLKNVGALPLGGNANDLNLIAKYRIGGYVQVDCTPEAIKRALYLYKVIFMGFRGSNGGWQTAMIRAPQAGEAVWGHATTGIGYKINNIKGQNSWGKDWGDNGKFYVPLNYMPFECWAVIRDLPNNWQDLLPKPGDKPKYQFNNQLYYGLRNDDVKVLQDCLKWLGCMRKEQTSTGYFGPITLAAVKLFQLRYGIRQTGYIGPLTLDKLNQLFN